MIHVQLYRLHEEKKPEKKKKVGLGESFKRPELKDKISENDWNIFKCRWDLFKVSAGLEDDEFIHHLYACLHESVETKFFRQAVNFSEEEEAQKKELKLL